jgi:hypothetical protein
MFVLYERHKGVKEAMTPDSEPPDRPPRWDDLPFYEKLDLIALPFLLPAFFWLMRYLMESQ